MKLTYEPKNKWPFGYSIVDEHGRHWVRQEALSHSTDQKTRLDNLTGKGFPYGEQKDLAVAANQIQDALGQLFAASIELRDALREMVLNACAGALREGDGYVIRCTADEWHAHCNATRIAHQLLTLLENNGVPADLDSLLPDGAELSI